MRSVKEKQRSKMQKSCFVMSTISGVMLVKLGLADGMVSGAIHSTADTVRPALQIIKTKPGISRTSGVFLMNRENTDHRFDVCRLCHQH